jgi:hypothetical protein
LSIWLAAWLVTAPCFAQEAPAGEPSDDSVMNFDALLLATAVAEPSATAADAARVEVLLRERFAQSNTITPMADVPTFEAQGYDGVQYMIACPEGQYSGCALVIGQRAGVDWVVGATVAKVADDLEPEVLRDKVEIHFIDVLGSEVIATFDVLLDGEHDAQIIDGVARAYDKMVQGAYDSRDLRDLEDPEQAEAIRKERADAVAASLAEMEEELGDVVRGAVFRRSESPRVTRNQLDAFDEREERAPWERVGMRKGEYLRFANSGKDLKTWRLEKNGRFGQVIARAGVGGGAGPYSQRYVSQILLDEFTLQPIHSVQLNELARGGGILLDLEAGVGVAPWVEVTGVLGFRTGKAEVLVDEDVQNQVAIPGRPSSQALNTNQYGVRLAFVPLVHSTIRPTVGLGFAAWSGVGIEGSSRQDPLPKPTTTFLELLPGAEVHASHNVNLFARGLFAIPMGGSASAYENEGAGMASPPEPTSNVALTGYAFQAGLTVRVGPFWRIDDQTRVAIPEDDEP